MNERLPFAIWGALLAAVVLAVACLDEHLLRRPAYIVMGAGLWGLFCTANWMGEELCVHDACQPGDKSKLGLHLGSMSLFGLGLLWFDLFE